MVYYNAFSFAPKNTLEKLNEKGYLILFKTAEN